MPIELIQPADAAALQAAREIFREYSVAIADVAACSLQYQRFEDELAALPGKYAPPRGRIYLAIDAPASAGDSSIDRPAGPLSPLGCIALRPLPELGSHVCELKRMYVRPAARGRGIGRMLAERVIADAASIGYTLMKLDTSDTMLEAQALYRSLGFVPCPAYNNDPAGDTLWFERVIRPDDADR